MRHIKSLETTVANQHVQITQLFTLLPKQPETPAVHIVNNPNAPTMNSHVVPSIITETPSLNNAPQQIPNPTNKQSNIQPSNNQTIKQSNAQSSSSSSNSSKRKEVIIVGDSMLKGIDGFKTSRKNFRVTAEALAGATVDEIEGLARGLATRKPDAMILHVGTNDLYPKSGRDTQDSTKSPRTEKDVADSINRMVSKLGQDFPCTKFIVSKLITREDKGKEGMDKVKNVNSLLAKFKHSVIDNSNIISSHLNGSKLHLKNSGDVKLALNFVNYLNTIC